MSPAFKGIIRPVSYAGLDLGKKNDKRKTWQEFMRSFTDDF